MFKKELSKKVKWFEIFSKFHRFTCSRKKPLEYKNTFVPKSFKIVSRKKPLYSLNLNQWIVTNYPVAYLALIISEVQLKKEEYLSII